MIQTWSKWAQKIRKNTPDVPTVDEVHLFPGWATKRLYNPSLGESEGTFKVVLHVSGFAKSRRTPEFLTRSQRAFLRLARSFACIPKPQAVLPSLAPEFQDCPELLHLPPRPEEIPDDYEVETLDAQFFNGCNPELDDTPSTPQMIPADTLPADLARFHENLESRLKPFWASSLSSRRIRVSVFLKSPDSEIHRHSDKPQPLLICEMLTGPDGHFSGTFSVDWRDIPIHPVGIHMTSDQTHVQHEILVEAQIINTESAPELHETPTNSVHMPITNSIVRVISDIDDTVKHSRVVDGPRTIFNQVFVKDLEDTIIPGMGEWYDSMWKRGVCFHYVSNSPFELLPVINQFINVSKLPHGSIRLRSYTGRSLFNGLLSAPATRKRGNVVEILDQFPESQFILVGDSGEQDLELYSSLAAERPGQISGVFIRDVNAVGLEDPTGIDLGQTNSPMKPRAKGTVLQIRTVPNRASSDPDVSHPHPGPIHFPRPTKMGSLPPMVHPSEPSPDLKSMSRVSEDSSSSIASSDSSSTRSVRSLTERERKRWELQSRVNKARLLMPSSIVLRVFEDPRDCMEAEQILRQLMM